MTTRAKIAIGLVALILIATTPLWYPSVMGPPGPPPQLELPTKSTQCVESTEFMNANHMKLLNEWRDAVVRRGEKTYTSNAFGVTYDMSLTQTCLGCHTNRDTFCARCHDYADVHPYCWQCHFDSQGR